MKSKGNLVSSKMVLDSW